jgi:hypothetical protein
VTNPFDQPGVPPYAYDTGTAGPKPTDFTYTEFWHRFAAHCEKVWRERMLEATLTLPDTVFPGLTAIINPTTGRLVEIQRVPTFGVASPFDWGK